MKVLPEREHIFLSRVTVHKYMNRELNLRCICRRHRPEYRKGHAHEIFPNLLQQNFITEQRNHIWCTDFTYMFLKNGSVRFNCTIIDLYDRSVAASENGNQITSDLAIRTLEKAVCYSRCDCSRLILHSDQGSQFTSLEFIKYCRRHGITQSMSRAGCPYDNAPMERYFNTLKTELINQHNFKTDAELDTAVHEFAYLWYNQIRPHSYNQYLTPFEKRFNIKFRHCCYINAWPQHLQKKLHPNSFIP